jgi:hypothetical protein
MLFKTISTAPTVTCILYSRDVIFKYLLRTSRKGLSSFYSLQTSLRTVPFNRPRPLHFSCLVQHIRFVGDLHFSSNDCR